LGDKDFSALPAETRLTILEGASKRWRQQREAPRQRLELRACGCAAAAPGRRGTRSCGGSARSRTWRRRRQVKRGPRCAESPAAASEAAMAARGAATARLFFFFVFLETDNTGG